MDERGHLMKRLLEVETANPSNRHRWSRDDIRAVSLLLRGEATKEQIALARIEGYSRTSPYEQTERLRAISQIAREALDG